MQAGPDLDRRVTGQPAAVIVTPDLLTEIDRSLDGVDGRAGKKRHHAVAEILVDETAARADDRRDVAQIRGEETEVLLRSQPFGELREVANVGEKDRHLALHVVAQLDVGQRLALEHVEKFARDEAVDGLGVLPRRVDDHRCFAGGANRHHGGVRRGCLRRSMVGSVNAQRG